MDPVTTSISTTFVKIAFVDPTSNNGGAITKYKVVIGNKGSTVFTE